MAEAFSEEEGDSSDGGSGGFSPPRIEYIKEARAISCVDTVGAKTSS